jgi:hypothetical protein
MDAFKPIFLLLLAGSTLPLLADEHRQYGAHEHGVGELDIAQEGAALQIELDSPAVNIVGFEHTPKTEVDHETLEKALARLEDGAGLFRFPDAAGCRLVDADIATPLQDDEDGEDEHHAGDPARQEAREHAEEHHAHEHSHGHEDETHADINATWRFSCAHPEALDRVGVQLFDAFPMTERLRVQFITGKHQGVAELTAGQPVLRF